MSKTKQKAQKLVDQINIQHKETREAMANEKRKEGYTDDEHAEDAGDISGPYVTMEDYQRGEFPWQIGNTGIYNWF